MKKQFKILILTLLIPFLGISNTANSAITKQKTIKKTYIVNADAGITIDNKYGNITVSTWDEDKIDLDILIKVSGKSENWVNERINSIAININALKSMVTAKTEIGNSNNSSNKNNSFEINYVIKIPKNGTVKLNNKYGNIVVLNAESTTDIFCKYGKVALGKLNGTKNNLQIEYCDNSSIDFIKTGTITTKYSDLKIGNSDKINLTSDYTDVTIENVDLLKYTSKYGTIKINSVKTLDAISNYLTLKINELTGQFITTAKYSQIAITSITPKAANITISSSYTDIALGFQPNYAFDFSINTNYGNFKYGSELQINSKEETNNSKVYEGFYKKQGANTVAITAKYGNVSLLKK